MNQWLEGTVKMCQPARQIFLIATFGVVPLLVLGRAMAQNTFPATGNVGIGTTAPGASLDARSICGGNIYRASDSTGQFRWRVDQTFGMYLTNAGGSDIVGIPQNGNIFFNTGGNIGIGTTNPQSGLDVFSWANEIGGGIRFSGSGASDAFLGFAYLNPPGNDVLRISKFDHGTNNNRVDFLTINAVNGNVGIGTTTPGSKLDIAGSIKLSGGGASIMFPDGSQQGVAWNGTLCGGDYAESVDVSGDRIHYEPGDVMVVSESDSADVTKSSQPYSTLVAGIYSTKPGVLGRRQAGQKSDQEIPMTMVGIVPTKVSAENGPIKKGDLLVTSSTPGHAMKGLHHSRMLGAIVGKAIGNLDSGTGVIEVLVSLQ